MYRATPVGAGIRSSTGGSVRKLGGRVRPAGHRRGRRFHLPAFAHGSFALDARLAAPGEGRVTVEVTPLTTWRRRRRPPRRFAPSSRRPARRARVRDDDREGDVEQSISVTSTTLPPGETQEVCGNCIDDGNGLTDFEDPAGCAEGRSGAFGLTKARLTPAGGTTKLRLVGSLPDGGSHDVLGQTLEIQLRVDGGKELLCARIPAGRFVGKKKTFRFKDRAGTPAKGFGRRS